MNLAAWFRSRGLLERVGMWLPYHTSSMPGRIGENPDFSAKQAVVNQYVQPVDKLSVGLFQALDLIELFAASLEAVDSLCTTC